MSQGVFLLFIVMSDLSMFQWKLVKRFLSWIKSVVKHFMFYRCWIRSEVSFIFHYQNQTLLGQPLSPEQLCRALSSPCAVPRWWIPTWDIINYRYSPSNPSAPSRNGHRIQNQHCLLCWEKIFNLLSSFSIKNNTEKKSSRVFHLLLWLLETSGQQ